MTHMNLKVHVTKTQLLVVLQNPSPASFHLGKWTCLLPRSPNQKTERHGKFPLSSYLHVPLSFSSYLSLLLPKLLLLDCVSSSLLLHPYSNPPSPITSTGSFLASILAHPQPVLLTAARVVFSMCKLDCPYSA